MDHPAEATCTIVTTSVFVQHVSGREPQVRSLSSWRCLYRRKGQTCNMLYQRHTARCSRSCNQWQGRRRLVVAAPRRQLQTCSCKDAEQSMRPLRNGVGPLHLIVLRCAQQALPPLVLTAEGQQALPAWAAGLAVPSDGEVAKACAAYGRRDSWSSRKPTAGSDSDHTSAEHKALSDSVAVDWKRILDDWDRCEPQLSPCYAAWGTCVHTAATSVRAGC